MNVIILKTNDLDKIQDDVFQCVLANLGDLSHDKDFRLSEIQPPESVIELAAKAATDVFMAFERGMRLGE